MNFSDALLEWYHVNKRPLPWRETRNPYSIWLSEIILQQTRVNQGMPYYQAFINAYPSVRHLAEADEQSVLKLWQGLGYYSRARNLLKCARQICTQHNSVFPDDFKELQKLPGIGDYTAAAIASIAFNIPEPVIDGNVFRVTTRLFGIEDEIEKPSTRKIIKEILYGFIPKDNPGDFNQAVMELGATLCSPQNPECEACPLAVFCHARKTQTQKNYPRKKAKKPVVDRFIHYLILEQNNDLYFVQKDSSDIWAYLWEFPMVESSSILEKNEVEKFFKQKWEFLKDNSLNLRLEHQISHLLSHRRLHISFWRPQSIPTLAVPDDFFRADQTRWEEIPKPKPIVKYLSTLK